MFDTNAYHSTQYFPWTKIDPIQLVINKQSHCIVIFQILQKKQNVLKSEQETFSNPQKQNPMLIQYNQNSFKQFKRV